MKKSLKTIGLVIAAVIAVAIAAIAGSVYDNATQALSATAGTGTWTNTVNYAAVKLVRIRTEASTDAGSTVTVARVYTTGTNNTVYTNAAITAIVAASSKGSADLTNTYLKNGDKLVFANSTATGATMVIEYEVQKH